MNLFDAKFLLASLLWGSIGAGYCLYGRRQQSWVPLAGGVLMIAAPESARNAVISDQWSVVGGRWSVVGERLNGDRDPEFDSRPGSNFTKLTGSAIFSR